MEKKVAVLVNGYLERLPGVEIYFVKIKFVNLLNILIQDYKIYIHILDKVL